MALLKILTFLAVVYVSLATDDDVVDLGDDDFSSSMSTYDFALVMFYAPWCGHCKRLKPEYSKASTLLRGNDPAITLVKVDCTEAGKDTCSKYSVSGYPTLKIFKKGELLRDYSGPREAAGIAKFLQAQVGPSSKELKTVKELETAISGDEVVVVGFFEKESDLKAAFLKVADSLREKLKFAHTSHSSLIEKTGHQDAIVLYRPKIYANKFEDSYIVYDGEADDSKVKDFIKETQHGLVGVRTKDNERDFDVPLVTAYYAVDYVKNAKGTNYWRNRILKVATEFVDDFTFAVSSKDIYAGELNSEYGIEFVTDDKPVVVARDKKSNKYIMQDAFSIDTFKAFVQNLKDGSLEKHIKSEPVPDQDGPVTVAVAKNFEDVVINNDKDTLIEFYAPWCGHCKKLAPIFDELGEKLKGENVAIVKMDATANDVPATFNVRGFPTLFWLKQGAKEDPISYEGGRELDDFISYIAKHSTEELKGYDRSGKPKARKTDEL